MLHRRASKMNGGGRANKELVVHLGTMEQYAGCSHASGIAIIHPKYVFPFLDFFFSALFVGPVDARHIQCLVNALQ